jgi:hypothetical protein
MHEVKITTIQVPPEMRDEIKAMGFKGETYRSVLRRLIDTYKTGVRVLPP